jgi:tRNA-modifying protein YgfZ
MDATILADYQRTREHAASFDVSSRGKIEVSGPDAARFLHNLCTNDILNLSPGCGCEAFFTTAQARVVAPAIIYRVRNSDGESFWLDVAPGLGDKLHRHLDRYLISEAVELFDRTADYGQLHIAGPEARRIVETLSGQTLSEWKELQLVECTVAGVAGCQVRRHSPLGLVGYDIACPTKEVQSISSALGQAGSPFLDASIYEILRVEAGMPTFGKDVDEERLAFDIGRDPSAICFTKGCYLGQEPIVMARDRGHANRKLVGLKISSPSAVPTGTKISRDGKEVGQTTSSVFSPRLGSIAMAYLRRGHQEPGTSVEVEIAGARSVAEVSSLPFSG